jgi:hypothetical protein
MTNGKSGQAADDGKWQMADGEWRMVSGEW